MAEPSGNDFRFRHQCDVENGKGRLERQPTDATIATLAQRQHGVVARRQLAELGIGRGAINARLRRGSLHLVHRGVYAVGHRRIDTPGRWMAATLACGTDAVLSHRSAALCWDCCEALSAPP